MPLSDSQVKAEQAGPRRRNVSVGDSLFLVIESVSRGGGKSFEGRMRFPPGRQGKQVPVRIGVYGKGVGKWSLKEARVEWDRIRSWSKQNGRDPRELKRQERQALIQQSSGPTLQQACESYLAGAKSKAAQKENPNLLRNQVLPHFGGETALEHLCCDGKVHQARRCVSASWTLRPVEARAPVQAKCCGWSLTMPLIRSGSSTIRCS